MVDCPCCRGHGELGLWGPECLACRGTGQVSAEEAAEILKVLEKTEERETQQGLSKKYEGGASGAW